LSEPEPQTLVNAFIPDRIQNEIAMATTGDKGRPIWVVTADREEAGRFIVRADEKLTAFLELEAVIRVDTKQRRRYRLRRNKVPNRKFQ
jgi:hypothetical protein